MCHQVWGALCPKFFRKASGTRTPPPPKMGSKGFRRGPNWPFYFASKSSVYQKMTQQKTMCNDIANYG